MAKKKTSRGTKKKKPPVARERTKRAPAPRQQELIEDRAIAPLERAAADYADIRDQRMELNQEEASLKQSLIRLMKRHGKVRYHRNGVTIELVSEAETVKVRVKKPGDPDADLPPGETGDDVDDDQGSAGEGGADEAGAEA